MGHNIANIKDYQIDMGDWVFDYVKDGKSKEYYDDYKISVDIINYNVTNQKIEKRHNIPLKNFGKIYKKNNTYHFLVEWDFKLHKMLYDILLNKNIKIQGKITLTIYTKEKAFVYYLQSPMGIDDVILSNKLNGCDDYVVTDYSNFEWMSKNGLILE